MVDDPPARQRAESPADALNSGEDYCTCDKVDCKLHGKCVECVLNHRRHGEHLPQCFRAMVNRRIEALSALTEHSMKPGSAE